MFYELSRHTNLDLNEKCLVIKLNKLALFMIDLSIFYFMVGFVINDPIDVHTKSCSHSQLHSVLPLKIYLRDVNNLVFCFYRPHTKYGAR